MTRVQPTPAGVSLPAQESEIRHLALHRRLKEIHIDPASSTNVASFGILVTQMAGMVITFTTTLDPSERAAEPFESTHRDYARTISEQLDDAIEELAADGESPDVRRTSEAVDIAEEFLRLLGFCSSLKCAATMRGDGTIEMIFDHGASQRNVTIIVPANGDDVRIYRLNDGIRVSILPQKPELRGQELAFLVDWLGSAA